MIRENKRKKNTKYSLEDAENTRRDLRSANEKYMSRNRVEDVDTAHGQAIAEDARRADYNKNGSRIISVNGVPIRNVARSSITEVTAPQPAANQENAAGNIIVPDEYKSRRAA